MILFIQKLGQLESRYGSIAFKDAIMYSFADSRILDVKI